MPTLGLHMIAGAGDADVLERCLKSIQGPLFDQVVVSVNGSDDQVFKACNHHGVDVANFGPWQEDFALARNHALSFLRTDYCAWIDSDDVITLENYVKLLELKKELDQHEVIYLQYVYSWDNHGKPATILPRERIWPNRKGYKWTHPIHECVWHDTAKVHRRLDIEIHHHPKYNRSNMDRNLRILEREWNKPVKNSRMAFYYARDLLDSNKWEKGEPVALECIDSGLVAGVEKAGLCRSLANRYFAFASDETKSKDERDAYRAKTERVAFIGIQASPVFAELWTFLGCVAYDRRDEDKAAIYFETALGCLREAEIGSLSPYYSLIPARNLFMINFYKGDFAKALMYNKLILEAEPNDEQAKQNRELTWKQWFNKYPAPPLENPVPFPNRGISVAWMIPWLNLDDPATRIRRVNVSQALEQMGIDSSVIHSYQGQHVEQTLREIRDARFVVFTQFSDRDLELMAAVKKSGKKVILDSCEAIFGIPGQREAWSLSDRVVCCSAKLAEMHKENGLERVAVVKDAVEIGVR